MNMMSRKELERTQRVNFTIDREGKDNYKAHLSTICATIEIVDIKKWENWNDQQGRERIKNRNLKFKLWGNEIWQ